MESKQVMMYQHKAGWELGEALVLALSFSGSHGNLDSEERK